MTLLTTSLILWLAAAAGETAPTVIQAPDSPVRVDHAKIFNVVPDEPAVLMYAATNMTDDDLEQFTVLVFFYDAEGTLKARQIAPGRRTLEKHTTKYLDHGPRRLGGEADRSGGVRRQPGAAHRLGQVVVGRARRSRTHGGQETVTLVASRVSTAASTSEC